MQAAAARLPPTPSPHAHPPPSHPRGCPGARTGGRAVGIQGRSAGSRAAGHLEVREHHSEQPVQPEPEPHPNRTEGDGERRAPRSSDPRQSEAARRESTGRSSAAAAAALNSATNWNIN